MTIEISFKAEINDDDYTDVKRGFEKCGAEIISNEFPEMLDIWNFKVEQVKNKEE